MKSLIRAAAGSFAARSGALSAFERAARGALAVLCYHRVLPEAERARYHTPDLVVTPETLRAHCRILAERYTVAPLGTALAAWQRGEVSDRPLVAITFDDGYRDNMRYATPILRAHGLRATFYVIAGLVDTDEQPWYDIVGAAFGSAARRQGDRPRRCRGGPGKGQAACASRARGVGCGPVRQTSPAGARRRSHHDIRPDQKSGGRRA